MKRFTIAAVLFAMSAVVAVVPAGAQSGVNVVQYALQNPVDNATMANPPSLGASVPASVSLERIEGAPNFGYFYYQGQPVIVDLRTRAIVRVGG